MTEETSAKITAAKAVRASTPIDMHTILDQHWDTFCTHRRHSPEWANPTDYLYLRQVAFEWFTSARVQILTDLVNQRDELQRLTS